MVFNWIQAPCKDCKDRQVNCHSFCERYKDYRDRHEAEATKLFHENATNGKISQMNYNATHCKEKLPAPLRHGRKKR